MKAAVIETYGGVESLRIAEVPDPGPAENGVVIRVHASSINVLDLAIRKGTLKLFTGSKFPKILGADYSGTIVSVGAKVRGLQVGDEVMGQVNTFGKDNPGSHAELVAVPADMVIRKPSLLSHVEAAAIVSVGLTALDGLRRASNVRTGDLVLINGASGGVGAAAVQIARALGARVTAVASGKNRQFVEGLGAESFVDYAREDFRNTAQKFPVIFDVAGNSSFFATRRLLLKGGTYVTTTPTPSFFLAKPLAPFFGKRAAATSSFTASALLPELVALIQAGQLRPQVATVLPFDSVKDAHQRAEAGGGRGKIVLHLAT
jgi:NADPH:quinone reductase-like Zn-dependent oxidoreductase